MSGKFIAKRVSNVRLPLCFKKPSGIKIFQLERISEYFFFVQNPGVRFTLSAFCRGFYVNLLGKQSGPKLFVRLSKVSALEHVRYN